MPRSETARKTFESRRAFADKEVEVDDLKWMWTPRLGLAVFILICGTIVQGEDTAESSEHLSILSWRLPKGKSTLDVDRLANVMAEADISVLQDVEFNDHGETPVLVISHILERRLNEKLCKAWFKNSKGERAAFAFVWRESALGFVDTDGALHDSCSAHPWVFHIDSPDVGRAIFYLKSSHKLFVLNAIGGEDAVPALRAEHERGWAVLFAGDMNYSPKNSKLADVRKAGFKPAVMDAIKAKHGGNQNIWFKNISLIAAAPVSLGERFSELGASKLAAGLGERLPVRAEFSFSEKEAEVLQTQMILKKKPSPLAPTKTAQIVNLPVYAAPLKPSQMSDLKEDIESEEGSLEDPPVKKTGSGKSKKRKSK
jgi:hypothetical protein